MTAAPPLAAPPRPAPATAGGPASVGGLASAGPAAMSEAEYLHTERTTAEGPRCEYDGSRRVPMPGASRRHSLTVKAVERTLDDLIAARPAAGRTARPLETHRESVRVRVPAGRYRYPDVFVCPAPPAMPDDEQDVVLNPVVIVEVLSPSTEHLDRGVKLAEYRAIPSLTDYVLLSQDGPAADHYRRTAGGAADPGAADEWAVVAHAGPDAAVPLTALGPLRLGAVFGES